MSPEQIERNRRTLEAVDVSELPDVTKQFVADKLKITPRPPEPEPTPTRQELALETITEVAEIFTGWGIGTWADSNGVVQPNTWFYRGIGSRTNQVAMLNPMIMFDAYHDTTSKITLDGITIPAGQTGEEDLLDFLDILGSHTNIAPTISHKLSSAW